MGVAIDPLAGWTAHAPNGRCRENDANIGKLSCVLIGLVVRFEHSWRFFATAKKARTT
jgi:hypothetical protein